MIDQGVRHGQEAVDLLPVEQEAWRGAYRLGDLAQILTMVGRRDEAIDQLDRLLSLPGMLTVPLLRLDPTWDSLRDHPRFAALLEKYEDGVDH